MSYIYGLLTLGMIVTAGCAPQRFTTQWSLSPALSPADASATETERRETERRQEVKLLKAERAELDQRMIAFYDLSVIRPIDFFSGALEWDRYSAVDRADIAKALGRIMELSHRKNVLSGRRDQDDEAMRRATFLSDDLRKWKPVIPPYYGH